MRRPGYLRFCVLAVLLAGSATACRKQDDAPAAKKITYTGPLLETTNVLMIVSDSAKLRIRLTAPLQQDFENGNSQYPKGVKLTFLDKDGEAVLNTITGNYGLYEKNKNLYTLRGDVRVTNVPKQQRLNTEEAFYDKQKATIYTKEQMVVSVTTPTERLEGRGLTANQDFSRYRILTPTGIFSVQSSPTAPPR